MVVRCAELLDAPISLAHAGSSSSNRLRRRIITRNLIHFGDQSTRHYRVDDDDVVRQMKCHLSVRWISLTLPPCRWSTKCKHWVKKPPTPNACSTDGPAYLTCCSGLHPVNSCSRPSWKCCSQSAPGGIPSQMPIAAASPLLSFVFQHRLCSDCSRPWPEDGLTVSTAHRSSWRRNDGV